MRFLSIYKSVGNRPAAHTGGDGPDGRAHREVHEKRRALATEGCLPTALGARVRKDGSKVTVKDGPFTESKEVVGGFAILQARSKEHAIELAKEFLEVAGEGECELRQIYEGPAPQ